MQKKCTNFPLINKVNNSRIKNMFNFKTFKKKCIKNVFENVQALF